MKHIVLSSMSIEPFSHIVIIVLFPIKMCGVGEASKEKNKEKMPYGVKHLNLVTM